LPEEVYVDLQFVAYLSCWSLTVQNLLLLVSTILLYRNPINPDEDSWMLIVSVPELAKTPIKNPAPQFKTPLRVKTNPYIESWENDRQQEIKELTSKGKTPYEADLDKVMAGEMTEPPKGLKVAQGAAPRPHTAAPPPSTPVVRPAAMATPAPPTTGRVATPGHLMRLGLLRRRAGAREKETGVAAGVTTPTPWENIPETPTATKIAVMTPGQL
jgi:hypothetical protein